MHGAKWVDAKRPAEILYENRHAPAAIKTWSDRVEDDEIAVVDGIRTTTPTRTALDLACRYPVDEAVAMIDARGIRRALIRAGFPRPQTQIPVYDEYGQLVAVLDMGWEDIKLAVEYEGDHHRTDRRRFNKDIQRAETIAQMGWVDVRVTAEDTEGGVVARVTAAWQRRT